MSMQDAKIEKKEAGHNPFAVQLESPMQTISAPGVCEMKPYPGEDSRWYSILPVGG